MDDFICLQAPGDPVIYKVQGDQRVGYRSWQEYEADGKRPVTHVATAELAQYELVDYFTAEFQHIGEGRAAGAYIRRAHIAEFPNKNDLLAASLANCQGDLYLEFGVLTGKSVNIIASQVHGRPVYGFDSFEGLPENWGPGFRRGHFKTSRMPVVASNVQLVVGWFEDVLPQFLEENTGQVAFAHIDSDVYSSAKYVLETLAEAGRLGIGTVLQFDELFAVQGELWYQGEFDAFREFVEAWKMRYRWLGHTEQAAALCVEGFKK